MVFRDCSFLLTLSCGALLFQWRHPSTREVAPMARTSRSDSDPHNSLDRRYGEVRGSVPHSQSALRPHLCECIPVLAWLRAPRLADGSPRNSAALNNTDCATRLARHSEPALSWRAFAASRIFAVSNAPSAGILYKSAMLPTRLGPVGCRHEIFRSRLLAHAFGVRRQQRLSRSTESPSSVRPQLR